MENDKTLPLIQAYEDYIILLTDELDQVSYLLANRKYTRIRYDKEKKMKSKIKVLKFEAGY